MLKSYVGHAMADKHGMKIKLKQYAVALYEAVKDAPKEKIGDILDNFVKMLIKNNALRFAPQIINYLDKYAKKTEGVIDLKVKTVQPLEEENLSQLKKIVPLLLEREIEKINVQQEIDPNLIGGFVLECDDLVFDASIKNKFNVLRKNLIQ